MVTSIQATGYQVKINALGNRAVEEAQNAIRVIMTMVGGKVEYCTSANGTLVLELHRTILPTSVYEITRPCFKFGFFGGKELD